MPAGPRLHAVQAKKGHSVEQLDDIRKLDLGAIDRVASFTRLHYAYSASAAVEGAAAGLMIGGGEAAVAFGVSVSSSKPVRWRVGMSRKRSR